MQTAIAMHGIKQHLDDCAQRFFGQRPTEHNRREAQIMKTSVSSAFEKRTGFRVNEDAMARARPLQTFAIDRTPYGPPANIHDHLAFSVLGRMRGIISKNPHPVTRRCGRRGDKYTQCTSSSTLDALAIALSVISVHDSTRSSMSSACVGSRPPRE
jgi:hypothetical protein